MPSEIGTVTFFFAFLLYRLGLALEEDYQPFPWAHECDAVSFDFNRPVFDSFSISSVLHFSNSVPFKTVSVDKSLRQLENTTFLRLILGSLFPVVLHNLKPSSCKLSVTVNHLFLPMKSVSKYTTPWRESNKTGGVIRNIIGFQLNGYLWTILQALDFLVRAHRTRTQSPGWDNDLSQIKEVVELTLHLSDGKQTCFSKKKEKRLNLRQLIAYTVIWLHTC